MATDSSELTFIRCPSCRSLVPAISTRCRMCGATLNATSAAPKDSTNADGRPSSRVRQRTVSMHSAPLLAGDDAHQPEVAKTRTPPDEIVSQSNEEAAPQMDPRDPLGAFLQEVPVEPQETKPVVSGEVPEQADTDEDLPEKFVPADTKEVAHSNGAHREKEVVVPVSEVAREPFNPVVAETPTPIPAIIKEKPSETKPVSGNKIMHASKKVEPPLPSEDEGEVTALGNGKLVGWLISYASPEGKALELREGKFFVTKASLKTNDLLLHDASISTPHALMKANVGEGLLIQDLMSDRGVFVRKHTGEGYQKSIESFKVEHGDWVRFGDVEFLVCLVAGSR